MLLVAHSGTFTLTRTMFVAFGIAAFFSTVVAQPTTELVDDVATLKPTGATSNFNNISINAIPSLAVDGNLASDFLAGSCYRSNSTDSAPVWYVDLGRTFEVHSVKIVNRGDCCGDSLDNITIDLTSGNPLGGSVGTVNNCGSISNGTTGVDVTTKCKPVTSTPTHLWFESNFPSGRYVRISKAGLDLTLCEVQVLAKSDNCMFVMPPGYP